MKPTPIYLEVGKKRAFAAAIEWPGWCRGGRDEDAAIAALLDYAPRYATVVDGFREPTAVTVVERLSGGAGTDFGAPGGKAAGDAAPITGPESTRQLAILRACWDAFDAAVAGAAGRDLSKGPRGGGRDLEKVVAHATESEIAYVAALGGKATATANLAMVHKTFLSALDDRIQGLVPDAGPRGGKRWPARFAIRYTAWHVLDHTWEIEDRSGLSPTQSVPE